MKNKSNIAINFKNRLKVGDKFIRWYIIITVLIFILRFLPLVFNYGAEHDSAWYLGLAKNLAHKGIYASSTNTVAYEGEGSFPSIHNKFSVQDKEGYVYFPAGVTVGPSYIVPQAILLAIFGDGWLQYRLWPLISFSLFLGLIFFLTYRLGGITSLVILQIWLWFLPQLSVNFVFEAFSEHLALLFVLSALLFCEKAIKTKQKKWFWFTGLFFSFAFLTKNLYLLNILVLVPIALFEIIQIIGNTNNKTVKKSNNLNVSAPFNNLKLQLFKNFIVQWLLVAVGFSLPIIVFEGYKLIFLLEKFGIESWFAVNREIQMTYQISGSGIDTLKKCLFDEKLFMSKFKIWYDIGLYQYQLMWSVFFLLPILLFAQKTNRLILYFLYSAALLSFLWFVLLSPLGWGRHIFHSLIISIILFSVTIGRMFTMKGSLIKIAGLTAAIFLLLNIVTLPKSTPALTITDKDIDTWFSFREERGIQGFPFAALVPIQEQKTVIAFFANNIRPQDRVYYLDAFVLADISALTDKILFPISRFDNLQKSGQKNKGISYLMLGPYQLTKYKLVGDNYFQKAEEKCEQTVFKNEHYFICRLKTK